MDTNAKTSPFYQTLLYLGYGGLPAHITNMPNVMSNLSDFLISLQYVYSVITISSNFKLWQGKI